MHPLLLIAINLIAFIQYTNGSAGDKAPFYQKCVAGCKRTQCLSDRNEFINTGDQPFHLRLLLWDCLDECKHGCMWKTVDAFHQRGWPTPQFHGKWPFARFLGIQEPASTFFSILNLWTHWKLMKRFRKSVRHDSPMFNVWTLFSIVCLNGWVCSTIFHARDLDITEFLDYAFAFAIVIVTCYCMVIRLLKDARTFVLIFITVLFLSFFLNHVAYLYLGAFDYGYNMQMNILLGTFTAILSFGWSLYNRLNRPYVWKCAAFFASLGSAMVLEIMDFPPILNTFDSHSLWHLCSAPITYLFYSFMTDDCKILRKEKFELSQTAKKTRTELHWT